ncbi:MAG: hypothetical protein DRP42_04940 [Tenericutes bacterium]|nr:MAG: hypothetical protein DRP42_04940 [Mycoplasmatota bacterium]
MVYGKNDMLQGALGAFSGVFVFYLIRAGNPISIDPTIGLWLGVGWLWLIFNPMQRHVKEAKFHFAGNLIITMVVTWYMSIWFGLVNESVLWTMNYFGSTAWLTTLIAFPVATLFDKHNITSILDRYYSRK